MAMVSLCHILFHRKFVLLGQAEIVPNAWCVLLASKMLAMFSYKLNLSFREKQALSKV